jgi:hypothetical protein
MEIVLLYAAVDFDILPRLQLPLFPCSCSCSCSCSLSCSSPSLLLPLLLLNSPLLLLPARLHLLLLLLIPPSLFSSSLRCGLERGGNSGEGHRGT